MQERSIVARSSKYFAPSTRERARRRLLERSAILRALLADVRSGKDRNFALEALGLERPGVVPGEALGRALDQVERHRILLVSDDERYGVCEVCEVDLGVAILEQMPWSDRCPVHAAS
jgi:hypothetical protein